MRLSLQLKHEFARVGSQNGAGLLGVKAFNFDLRMTVSANFARAICQLLHVLARSLKIQSYVRYASRAQV